MSEAWSALSEIADLRMGETITTSDCDGFGLPIYSADTGNTPWNYSSNIRRKLPHGTIIVGARGSIGYPRMPNASQFGATQTTITVTPRIREIRGRFLLWQLRWAELSKIALQQAVPMLTVGDLGRLQVRVFSEQEQAIITEILDTLDTQIRRTEEVIAKLEQVKQGLLTDLLTRGIDENGELRPSPVVAPELYKDSPVGWIPSEWNAVQVKDIADVKGGKRLPSGHDYAKEKTSYRYLRVTDFFERQYRLDHLYCLNEETFTELARYEIRPGDLYISIAGSIGYAGVHQPEDLMSARVILTENAARLVLRTDAVPDYLALAINDHRVQSQIEAEKGTGGGVPKLALFRIENLWLALPGENEQKKICSRMRSVAKRNELEEFTLQKLWAQKTGLMDDLLTGRVRVTPLLEQAEQATG